MAKQKGCESKLAHCLITKVDWEGNRMGPSVVVYMKPTQPVIHEFMDRFTNFAGEFKTKDGKIVKNPNVVQSSSVELFNMYVKKKYDDKGNIVDIEYPKTKCDADGCYKGVFMYYRKDIESCTYWIEVLEKIKRSSIAKVYDWVGVEPPNWEQIR